MRADRRKAPPPEASLHDFRYEKPAPFEKLRRTSSEPYATPSANKGPELVARPENVWPIAPAGFKVEMYATGLDNPRTLLTAPNGDIFLTESDAGRIRIFRGLTADGKPELSAVFATGLKHPYGWPSILPGLTRNGFMFREHRRSGSFRVYHKGELKRPVLQTYRRSSNTGGHGRARSPFSQMERNSSSPSVGLERE